MARPRVIPVLLLKGAGFVKTVKFKNPTYLGDPINIVKIFNDKEVDELVVLDITATNDRRPPRMPLIKQIAEECFMPLCYGGGITQLDEIKTLIATGVEKVALNTRAIEDPDFVRAAARLAGSQSIVVSIDVRKGLLGKYEVFTRSGTRGTKRDPVRVAQELERSGAGEILLNSMDRDGSQQGYDLELVQRVTRAVGVPVVAVGGAGSTADLVAAVRQAGAAAAGAGSLFVFQGRHRAVLINVPAPRELAAAFG